MRPLVIVLASGRGERFLASGGSTHKLQALLAGKTVLQHALDAVRATAEADGWLILPGDLPLIQPETLRLLATAPPQHEVVVPVYQGQRGHPVRFSRACAEQLMALQGNQGAGSVAGTADPASRHALTCG